MAPSRTLTGFAVLGALLLAGPAALLLAGPAAAEIYRWTDASGREHFTMDLHGVPPEHRAEAERRAALDEASTSSEPAINTMTTPDASRVKRALRPRYSRPAAPAGTSCSSTHRRQAQQLASNVARWEKKVELQEQLESRLVRTEDRLRAENRAERYQIYLEQAQQAQEDFEDRMRHEGVPPGCYR